MNVSHEIEYAITIGLNPDFLAISFQNGYFHVVLSHAYFEKKPILYRIRTVYNAIREYNKDILRKNVVIIEAYDNDEINDLLKYTFESI